MLETGGAGSAHAMVVTMTCQAGLAKDLLPTTWKSPNTVSVMTPLLWLVDALSYQPACAI